MKHAGRLYRTGRRSARSAGHGSGRRFPLNNRLPQKQRPESLEDLLTRERKIPLVTTRILSCSALPSRFRIGVVFGLIFWLITGAQELFLMVVVPDGFLALVFLLVMPVLRIAPVAGPKQRFSSAARGVPSRPAARQVT